MININNQPTPYEEIKMNYKELTIDTFQDIVSSSKLPKTFIINLDSSTDRLTDITERAKKENIEFERWSATDGRILSNEELHERGVSIWSSDMSKERRGAFGCFLSHRRVWKHLMNQSKDTTAAYLILEDDVVFSSGVVSKITEILKNTPSDWDILMLGYGSPSWHDEPKEIGKLRGFDGTYAYLINSASLQKIVPYFEVIGEPIDTTMSRFAKSGVINIYAVNPPIITPGNHASTIR